MKLKLLSVICIMSLYLKVQAQLHDKNWVFGGKNLLTFINNNDSLIFQSIDSLSDNFQHENVACISNHDGKLLFYNDNSLIDSNFVTDQFKQQLLFYQHNVNNGECIFKTAMSCTNGTVVLPIDSLEYLYVYLSYLGFTNNYSPIYNLNYHLIKIIDDSTVTILKKEKILFNDFILTERLKAVKHPNGKDWWLIIQQHKEYLYSDTIISILINRDSIVKINFQKIGVKRFGNNSSIIGEIAITKKGDKIAMAYNNDSLEVLDFNRCTGLLSNAKLYKLNNQNLKAYGLEFSPNGQFLYVNSSYQSPLINGKLQQIKLTDGSITDLIIQTTLAFQIERGPDDKLYFGYGGDFYRDSVFYPNARSYLHCIERPDSGGLACDINIAKIKLNNDFWNYGLPNFPNYRLPALSIFEAEAGSDTLICTDDSSSQKVVQLGSPTINGVTYQWYPNYNLSSDTTAQPLAFPDSTTWYYVTLTDTTIQDACQSRTDSVLVEVRRCSVGIENAILKTYDYKIHPTLIGSELRGYIVLNEKEEGYIELYDIMGNKLAVLNVKAGRNELEIPNHIHNGLVTYRVFVNTKIVRTDKLIFIQ